MKIVNRSNVEVWDKNGKQIFPNAIKTIPTGSIIKQNFTSQFVTIGVEHKWVRHTENDSDCTGMYKTLNYVWDIQPV